ncbi:MAG TPA: replicative DNA helicase [Ktedonobacterales bacterium]|jgi:replicative DNA helicase
MEKLLPQNIEAEEGVLGSIIIDPEAVVQVADFLRPEDFYRDAHRAIFQAVLDLYAERGPADLITLCDELQRRGRLEEVGGAAYISSLVNAVPTSANVEYYARIVERESIMRRLIHAAGQMAALAYNESDANIALDKAEQLIFSISQRYNRSDFDDLRTLLEDYYEKLDKLHEQRGSLVGLPTGFHDLDKMTGGLQKSDLIILAARPAVGKSALALSLAYNTALKKNRVAFFALEMSKEQLVQRLLAMDTGIDQQRLRTGMIEDEEWERISRAIGRLSQIDLYIDDTAGISTMEMRSKARRLAAERGIDLVIVDYLQLMQGHAGGRNENRVQEISEISRNLKALARELDVPVLALSQLSRAVESRQSRVPQLSDLRESGCLTGETLIYLPDEGSYRRIDSLVGQSGFNVLALNTETWKLEPRPVLRAFSTGHKLVYQLKTQLGRSIRATGNHQFLTIEGWRRLDEMKPEMRIALPRTLPGPQTATVPQEELALLEAMGIDGLRSYEKFVPACVFAQPREEIACFLRHLWATDGTAWSHITHAPTIYYATSSLKLVTDVQSLLLRLDINARVICVPQPNKGRDQYHVDVSGKPDQERFINQIGIVGERKQKMLEGVRAYLATRTANTNRDVVPRSVWREIVYPARVAVGMTERQMQAAIGVAYCGSTLAKSNLSRERATRVAEVVRSEELMQLASSDVYWDEIVSIELDSEEEVYDLTVEGLHNFVGNNIIAHNSIEQDSDIVLFIYRDEIYNPDSDRKNIADIIVAKHRNGPIGQFSLYFKSSQTLFRNLDLHGTQP